MLLRNLPHALHSAEHVAAPQHDAATDHSVAALGNTSSGSESSAPMVSGWFWEGAQASAIEVGTGCCVAFESNSLQGPSATVGRYLMADFLGEIL